MANSMILLSKLEVAQSLQNAGATVKSVDQIAPGLLLVGYRAETYLMLPVLNDPRHNQFIAEWQGRKIHHVRTQQEALSIIGVGNRWVAWRIERDKIISDAVREAIKYKAKSTVHAAEILPFQEIYETPRGLGRTLLDMCERGLLIRYSYTSGYAVPRNQ